MLFVKVSESTGELLDDSPDTPLRSRESVVSDVVSQCSFVAEFHDDAEIILIDILKMFKVLDNISMFQFAQNIHLILSLLVIGTLDPLDSNKFVLIVVALASW